MPVSAIPRNENHRDNLARYLTRVFGLLPKPEDVGSADCPLSFRPLTAELLDQKAWVHSRTWRETYQGLIPGPLLSLVSPDFAKNVTLKHGFGPTVLAMAGRRVIGYAEWLPSPRPPFVDPDVETGDTGEESIAPDVSTASTARPSPAELAAIYLLRDYQHRGIGTRLFQATLQAAGSPQRVMLWVFDGNESAQRFYQHLGFRPTGQTQSEDNGQITEQAWLLDRGALHRTN